MSGGKSIFIVPITLCILICCANICFAENFATIAKKVEVLSQQGEALGKQALPILTEEQPDTQELKSFAKGVIKLEQELSDLSKQALETASQKPTTEIDILLKYLLLALLFEAVYSAIFQWSLFLRIPKDLGVRTIVKVGLAWLAIANYPGMNVMHDLAVNLFNSTEDSAKLGQFITALLLAGGSSAIYDIMKRYLRDSSGLKKREARIQERSTSSLDKRLKEIHEQEILLEEARMKLEEEVNTQGRR